MTLGNLVVPLLLALVLAPVPLAVWLYRAGHGHIGNVLACLVPYLAWLGCVLANIRLKSLSNLVVEVPLVGLATLLVLASRLIWPHRIGGWLGLIVATLAAIGIYALVPVLPE